MQKMQKMQKMQNMQNMQTMQTMQTKLLGKAVNAWVRSSFGNVSFYLLEYIRQDEYLTSSASSCLVSMFVTPCFAAILSHLFKQQKS